MPRNLEKQKAAKKLRYESYRQLCATLGVRMVTQTWWRHYAELQEQQDAAQRLTAEDHRAYWTERLTARELHGIAAGLDFLSTEGG